MAGKGIGSLTWCDRTERERKEREGVECRLASGRGGRTRRKVSAAVGMLLKVRRDDGDRGDAPLAGHSRNITKVMLLNESYCPRGPFENFVKRSVCLSSLQTCLSRLNSRFSFQFHFPF